ncbi:MAG: hypothetical protein SVQ76_00390 [Candidatus Nanohaloarchaea archaeon]|nr:hypothetical protein [Candidatus Nanohaloarchaea archaeon]
MDELKRFGAASALVFGALLIGFAAGGFPSLGGGGGAPSRYTVTGLMQDLPLKQEVVVEGNVSEVLDDYVSESNSTYQRFYITDGGREVVVFCSTFDGRVQVSRNDSVRVSGTFKEYYGQYEIYTSCRSVRKS